MPKRALATAAASSVDVPTTGAVPKKSKKASKASKEAPDQGSGSGSGGAAPAAAAAPPAAGAASPPAPIKPGKLPPHKYSGADPSTFTVAPHDAAASMEAFTGSLPPRTVGGVKVLVYNVNGLRALLKPERKAEVMAWLTREDADVLCVQEIKADQGVVEKEGLAACFQPLYPHAYFASGEEGMEGFKKGYAGVAVFSKHPALSAQAGLGSPLLDGQGRVLTVKFPTFTVVNLYAPNSGQKLERLDFRTNTFDPAFAAHLKGLLEGEGGVEGAAGAAGAAGGGAGSPPPVLCVGDFNVAHQNCDVLAWKTSRNKIAGFCDGERDRFGEFLGLGYRDVWRDANPTTLGFTYYSTRHASARAENKGWRVDYALASPGLKDVTVDIRGTFPKTDHLPFIVQF